MHDNILKFFIICLLSINLIFYIRLLYLKNNILHKNKNILNTENQKVVKKHHNLYQELINLYFENKEKFYLRGRKHITKIIGIKFNENNIATFQDKLNYLLVYESPEEKMPIVDKILFRNYTQQILGKDLCVPILKIYDDIDDINLDELPEKFVLKCNHGSGMNIFCQNKNKFNLTKVKHILKYWLDINYGLFTFEYQYLNVKRKVFVEKFLSKDIVNYKFSCFNGEPKFVRVKANINGTNLYNIYYTNWTISGIELDNKKYVVSNIFMKPKNLNQMVEYARLLSSKFYYCRVDFYEVDGILYLGEITFTPFNSQIKFKKKETEIYLGNLINISKINKTRHL